MAVLVTFAREYDSLARALADLVGRSSDEWASDPTSARSACAVRDVIATRLTAMAAAVVNAPSRRPADFPVRLVVTDPGHALHAALADLPPALTDHRRRADLLFAGPRHEPGPWQRATRACAYLEPYTETLRTLDGPTAWTTLRGIADLSRAVLLLDIALTTHREARHAEPGRHGALRIAADELCACVPAERTQPQIPLPPPPRPIRVATIGDLPHATQRLAAMLHARGSELTATEVRAASSVLVEGMATTARALAGHKESQELAGLLVEAMRHAQHLDATPMQTLTMPSAPVRYFAGEIVAQLRAADGILDRLDADSIARPSDRRAVAAALLPWAAEAANVAAAVDAGLRASHERALLLAPSVGPAASTYRWMRATALDGKAEVEALAASYATQEATARIAVKLTSQREPQAELAASRPATRLAALADRDASGRPLAPHPADWRGSRRAKERAGTTRRHSPPRPAGPGGPAL
ncbi:MAG: hypothetical protein ACT4QF_05100 [Sporichthyaceae bacterium]